MSTKSFIRFSTAPELSGFEGGVGLLTEEANSFYAMPMQPADEIRFIFSLLDVIDFEVDTLKVAVLQGETVVFDDVLLAQANDYWTLSIPEALTEGCYRFLIYDQTFNATEWVTTGTECEEEDEELTGYQLVTQEREVDEEPTNTALAISNAFIYAYWKQAPVIEFRGRQNGWGFDYETNPDFYQRFRLELVLNRAKYPDIKKVYRQSNGIYRHANVTIDKRVTLETDYLDELTHDAMANALKHDEFYIEAIAYFSSEEYEPEWVETGNTDNRYYELAKAATELYVQGYDQRNNQCGGVDQVGILPPECIEVSPGDSLLVG